MSVDGMGDVFIWMNPDCRTIFFFVGLPSSTGVVEGRSVEGPRSCNVKYDNLSKIQFKDSKVEVCN
jgi:hypothetical protein